MKSSYYYELNATKIMCWQQICDIFKTYKFFYKFSLYLAHNRVDRANHKELVVNTFHSLLSRHCECIAFRVELNTAYFASYSIRNKMIWLLAKDQHRNTKSK